MNELLNAFKAKRDEIGATALADALGISKGAVRMVCTGHYPNPEKVLEKFAQHYVDVVQCPFIDDLIQRQDCLTRSSGPRPFGGQLKLNWWQACQTCPHKKGGV